MPVVGEGACEVLRLPGHPSCDVQIMWGQIPSIYFRKKTPRELLSLFLMKKIDTQPVLVQYLPNQPFWRLIWALFNLLF